MGNKKRIILSTDDITPENIKKYWRFWKCLKEDFPELRLNAFVIPLHEGKEENNILQPDFINWFEKEKSWVNLNLHGYTHLFPPECSLSYDIQRELIEKGALILGKVTKKTFGFKAPGYIANEATKKICEELRFNFLAREDSFSCFHKHWKKDATPIATINTHTNGITADSIEKIHEKLKEEFLKTENEFIFIEELLE